MKALAEALVIAVSYISGRHLDGAESPYDDDDVRALESIVDCLNSATPAEEDALAAAAEHALAEELAAPLPRPEFVDEYGRWMECTFGENWCGNQRVSNAQ